MKKYHLVGSIVILIVMLVGITACGQIGQSVNPPGASTQTTFYPLEVTDDAQRTVILDRKPERIISFAPGHTETLFALDLGDKVVGLDDFSDYPAATAGKERVGGVINPNYEKIVALSPDLVLTVGSAESPLVKRLAELGVPVVVLQAASLEDIFADMATIGRITDRVPQADTLINELRDEVDGVKALIGHRPENEKATVFYEVSPPGEWGMWTVGPGSFIHDLIIQASGVNIAADGGVDYLSYSEEVLVAKNPQVIITPNPETLPEIGQRSGWGSIAAVQSGRVYLIDRDQVSRPGPRIADAFRQVAAALYPDRVN
jgi:iron complex transport system substrate-binding protein